MANSISVAVADSETISAGRLSIVIGPLAARTVAGKAPVLDEAFLDVSLPLEPQAAATRARATSALMKMPGIRLDMSQPPVFRELRSTAGMALSHDRPSSRAGPCIRPGQASWLVPRRGLTVAGQHR